MKLSEKFWKDLRVSMDYAFKRKNLCIGVTVQDITIDEMKGRGILEGDIEGAVVLTVEEAKRILGRVDWCQLISWGGLAHADRELGNLLRKRIEQAEGRK